MDRRRNTRIVLRPEERLPVSFVLLGPNASQGVTCQARIADWSDGGLCLLAPNSVHLGTPVRVELSDRLVLGDVCFCRPQPDGHFAIGVRVSQVLEGLASLRRLAARLMGTPREEILPVSQL